MQCEVHDFENKTNWFLSLSIDRFANKSIFNIYFLSRYPRFGEKVFLVNVFLLKSFSWFQSAVFTGRNINVEEFLKIFKLIRCTLLKWMHKSTILHWRLRFYWDAALVSFQMLNFSHHSIFPHIKLSWRTKFQAAKPELEVKF